MARKAKKLSKLSTTRGAQAKVGARRRRNGDELLAPKSNPPLFSDLIEFVLPGFAGYAGTRLVSRIAYTQLSKRYPKAGVHLAAGTSIASFLAAWFLLHRFRKLERYHVPAAVGSAIAAIQTLVQTYLPKFGWMVSDYRSPELAAAAAASNGVTNGRAARTIAPDEFSMLDEEDELDDASESEVDVNPKTPVYEATGLDDDDFDDLDMS